MSATNSTTYYNLPIFIGTDVPTWLVDWNGAMNKIDEAIKGVDSSASTAKSTANQALSVANATQTAMESTNEEVATIKEAVQNYDQILDFVNVPISLTTNNIGGTSGAFLAQNTNKTLSKGFVRATFNASIDNLIQYNYTATTGTVKWLDIFTAEDNCFKLTQGSQPSETNALTLGVVTWTRKDVDKPQVRYLRAWFDGATTHIGVTFTNADVSNMSTRLLNSTIWGNFSVFLTGSIYNPVQPPTED